MVLIPVREDIYKEFGINLKKLYLPFTLWLLLFLSSIQIINVSRNQKNDLK